MEEAAIRFIERGRVVPIGELEPDPHNPRHGTGSVDELARSFTRVGQLVPLIVSPHPDGPEGHRWIVRAGHRRLAAGHFAELPTMTVDVVPLDTSRAAIVAAENVARRGLSLLEEVRLLEDAALTVTSKGRHASVAELAAVVGLSETWVRRRLRLAHLTERARGLLERMTVDAAHTLAAFSPNVQDRIVDVLEGRLGDAVTLDRAAVLGASHHARRRLSNAPFKLDVIYGDPERPKCEGCGFRSDTQIDLFGASEAYCLDVDCYEARGRAAYVVELEAQQAAGGLVSDATDPWTDPYGSELVRVDAPAWAGGVGHVGATWREKVGVDALGPLTLLRDPVTGAPAWGADRKRAEKALAVEVKKAEKAEKPETDKRKAAELARLDEAKRRGECWGALRALDEAMREATLGLNLNETDAVGQAGPYALIAWLQAFAAELTKIEQYQGLELSSDGQGDAWRWFAISAVEYVGPELFDVVPLVEGVDRVGNGYGEKGRDLVRLAREILGNGHRMIFDAALAKVRAEVAGFDELVRVTFPGEGGTEGEASPADG